MLWSIKFNPLFAMINVHSDKNACQFLPLSAAEVSVTSVKEECLRPDGTL